MRRLLGACLVVSVLALAAGAGTARAQTPAPTTPPAIPWDEAELSWAAPTVFATPTEIAGASLADCATGPCQIRYIVEAKAPNGNGWGPIDVTDATTYRVKGLTPGLWQFRVKAFFRLTGYSLPSAVGSKTVVAPIVPDPVMTPPTGMNVK